MQKVILTILFVLFLAASADAVKEKYGPIPQYSGHQWTPGPDIVIPTTNTWNIYSPATGKSFTFGGWGGGTYTFYYDCPTFVSSYLYIDSPFNPGGNIHMIEVVAYDLQQNYDANKVPQQKGFTAGNPEVGIPGLPPPGSRMTPSPGQFYFTGLSGTKYDANGVEQCTKGNIASRLAGFNVSQFTGPTSNLLYIVTSPPLPASDFTPFVFSFDYMGIREYGDPNWVGPADANWPYQHEWKLNITQWNPSVQQVSDVDIEAPVIIPGYVDIVPPPNWIGGPWHFGRYSYEANPGNEITAGGGTYGWIVKAKTPYLVPGHVYLTNGGSMVSNSVSTMVVDQATTSVGQWSFFDGDLNQDGYVNFEDFAVIANQWLQCSDPEGGSCSPPEIAGLGFAFNANDTVGPVKVVALYDTHVSGIDVNDVIVEYQGQKVESGAALASIIRGSPALTTGDTVTLKLVKQASLTPVVVSPVAISLPISVQPIIGLAYGRQCVSVLINQSNTQSCQCILMGGPFARCGCHYITQRDSSGKIIAIMITCGDTLGNKCTGDWLAVN